MTPITVEVVGLPAPQGSKKHVGRGIMVESSKNVKPWREAVKHAALTALALDGGFDRKPLALTAVFRFARPQGHYGTGKNAEALKPLAPAVPAGKPDLDKLLRSTLDALADACCFRDDSQVVALHAAKRYCDPGELPGATLHLTEYLP